MASQHPQPIYGNFQRYYHIRNPTSGFKDVDANAIFPALGLDSRLVSILTYLQENDQMQRVRDVLDLGCNSGKVTIQLAQMLCDAGTVTITGVDIDATLIRQARDAAAIARSLCRPSRVAGRACTKMESSTLQLRRESVYFPSVFPALFGPISAENGRLESLKPTDSADECSNLLEAAMRSPRLDFVAAEWVDCGSPVGEPSDHKDIIRLQGKDANGYDLVLALSLTKWIHIHAGDVGLARFFARMSRCLRPDGLLVLEPQDWKSYDAPKRMSKAIRDQVQALKLRPHGDFHWLLESVGLVYVKNIGVGVGTGFTRPLQVFRKPVRSNRAADTLVDDLLGNGQVQFAWVARVHIPNAFDL